MMKATDREGKISELGKSTETEISGILNDKQMTAFNSTKDEWWKEVTGKVHPESVRQQTKEKEKPY